MEPSEPRFTIAIPAYNAETTLAETIESALAQTYPSWEMVIVDDGSTDRTYEIASEYARSEPRIRVLRQTNQGCGVARGVAAEAGVAPFIARMDADDIYLSTYFEEFSDFIDAHPGYDIYSCNAVRFYPGAAEEPYNSSPRFQHVMSLTFEDMLEESVIFPDSVFSRRLLGLTGGFRPDAYVEDYDFWLRAFARGACHIHLPRQLVRYRSAPGQMTSSPIRIHEGQVEVLENLIQTYDLDDVQRSKAERSLRLLRANIATRRLMRRVLPRGISSRVAGLLHWLAGHTIRRYRRK